jgi:protein-S-isoprenylcysteine O-methyltransferase Ste14
MVADQNQTDPVSDLDKPLNGLLLMLFTVLGAGIQAPIFFFTAGDWTWIEAWVYILLFLGYFIWSMSIINKKNPRLIRNRIKQKKEGISKPAGSDKIILPIFGLLFTLAFVLPSIDYRFDWTTIPIAIEIIGFMMIVLGFYLLHLTMMVNAYASKVLDIREGQKLIDTGVYAHVRHPMYSGFSLFVIGIPIALGSWYGLIPAILAIITIYIRCNFEEKMLIDGLEGYIEYMNRVKFRLIPYIL